MRLRNLLILFVPLVGLVLSACAPLESAPPRQASASTVVHQLAQAGPAQPAGDCYATGPRPADGWHSYIKPEFRRAYTRAEVARMLATNDRRLGVSPEVIMRQVACELRRGEWESVQAFARWLERSEEVSFERCIDGLEYLGHSQGKVFHRGHTRKCDQGEMHFVYHGRRFLSSTCLNVMPGSAPQQVVHAPAVAVQASGACAPSRRDGSMRLCLQAFIPQGAAAGLACVGNDSRNVPPDVLRRTVPLFMERAPMHVVIRDANIGPAGSSYSIPDASGKVIVFRVNQRGHLHAVLDFAGETTLYLPPQLGTPRISVVAWSEHPALMHGYPQNCDCEEDGYGSNIPGAKGGAMRVRAQDGFGAKMARAASGQLRSGEQDRLVLSWAAANPRR